MQLLNQFPDLLFDLLAKRTNQAHRVFPILRKSLSPFQACIFWPVRSVFYYTEAMASQMVRQTEEMTAPMSTRRWGLAATSLDGAIYALGGKRKALNACVGLPWVSEVDIPKEQSRVAGATWLYCSICISSSTLVWIAGH